MHLSKFINMKILKTKLGKKKTVSYNNIQLMHSFSVNIRISQPTKVMFTEVNITILGLTNPDVNLKRMHQLYVVIFHSFMLEFLWYKVLGDLKGWVDIRLVCFMSIFN